MDLKIDTVHVTEDHTRVNIIGEIDAYTAPKVREVLFPLCERINHVIEVNLHGVEYMDSTGLGIFVGAHKGSVPNQSELSLTNLTPRVARLFDITGLSEIIHVSMLKERGGDNT